jgi:hypothetical protein
MKPLLFAARLAFLCNLLFLVCVIIQRTHDFIHQSDISNIIIILGWMVAPFLNLIVNILYGIMLLNKSAIRLPLWLGLANLFFLIAEIYVYLILPK